MAATGTGGDGGPQGDLGGLAEASSELSSTEWALPTDCPGWDVKDQLSHLIGIERSILGEAPPPWDGPLGDHVKNDFAAMNEPWVAVRRPLEGQAVRAEFVDVTTLRLAELGERTEEEWAVVGFSPVGQVPYAVFMEVRVFDSWVHEQDARRALDRPGGCGNLASAISLGRVEGAMPFVVGKKASCRGRHVSALRDRGPRATTPAPSLWPSWADAPGWWTTMSRRPSPCRSRASISSVSAVAGSAPPRRRRRAASSSTGTVRSAAPSLAP